MATSRSMSRIARKPVVIPAGVEVKLHHNELKAKGPKGNVTIEIHPFVEVILDGGNISIKSNAKNSAVTGAGNKLYRSIAGTTRANIFNGIHGVTHGFEKKLLLVGVGYKAQAKGKILSLSLGFSHPTEFHVPEGVVVETPVPTEILIKGVSKELVGEVAAKIRLIRSPEPYKGKGVRHANETIELKETKKK